MMGESHEHSPLLAHKNPSRKNWVLQTSILLNVAALVILATSHSSRFGRHDTLKLKIQGLPQLEWWSEAAARADQASKVYCSGHGRVHVDSLQPDVCECTSCFTGKDCSHRTLNCTANVDGGDPLFLEPFWETNAEAGALVVPPTYRMSYSASGGYTTGSTGCIQQLEMLIRQVHTLVGNAVTKDRFILIGTGSYELVNAAVASLAKQRKTSGPSSSSPSVVVSRVPYYSGYKQQTEFFTSSRYFWAGDPVTASSTYNTENSSYIELVASPNNPDCSMLEPVLNASSVIYDRAYYWPHFTAITKAVDDDVTLFTLSKLTGHAGTRLGWAIVRDETLYREMAQYVSLNTLGVSHDGQLRATALLRGVIQGYGSCGGSEQRIFHFAHSVMSGRWKRVSEALEKIPGVSLYRVQPQYCLFFNKVSAPSPAYAWVRCEDEGVTNCYDFFLQAGIQGRAGEEFGADEKYLRFALITHNDHFEQLIDRLKVLASSYKASITSI